MTKSTLLLIGSSLGQTDQLIRNRSLDFLGITLNSKIGNHDFSTTIRKTPQYVRPELRGKNRVGKFQRKKKKESFFSFLREKKLSFFFRYIFGKEKKLSFLSHSQKNFPFFSFLWTTQKMFSFFSFPKWERFFSFPKESFFSCPPLYECM